MALAENQESVEEDDIRNFLVENPDYLQRNPDLLGLLQIPHGTGGAVSLVERQVSVLRERNVDLRHRLRELGSAARDNDQLFADTRTLVLTLLEADTPESLHRSLMSMFRDNFGVEYARLLLFEETDIELDVGPRMTQSLASTHFSSLAGRDNAGCGPLRADEFEQLFPGSRIVGSAAIAYLNHKGSALGVLAVGSSDAGHYESGMGTLFLEFAADVVVRRLMGLSSP